MISIVTITNNIPTNETTGRLSFFHLCTGRNYRSNHDIRLFDMYRILVFNLQDHKEAMKFPEYRNTTILP